MFPEQQEPVKELKGIDLLESTFNERFQRYRDGLITRGELLNNLIIPLSEEMDKYTDELESAKSRLMRELTLIDIRP